MPWTRYFALSDEPGSPPPSWRVRALNFVLAVLAISLVFYWSFRHLAYHLRWSSIYHYRALFWQGWLTTIGISIAALVLSAVIGLLSALDPEMTAEVLDMIKELREEGRDFILVTHEMGFARQVADQAAFLAGGRILEAGPVAPLFDTPTAPQTRDFLSKVLKY
jgi:ABC-type Na+ transport system ATPase subunit NatA